MNKFSAEHYINIVSTLHWFAHQAELGNWDKNEIHTVAASHLQHLSKRLLEIGCKLSSKAADRLAWDVENLPPIFVGPKIDDRVKDLHSLIYDEMQEILFLRISPELARYYEHPLHKWDRTKEQFPSTVWDIAEGSVCLALQRNTACVFHIMRVVGAGVAALGRTLNEPSLDASRNLTWDNVLSKCTKELGEKFSGKSAAWQQDKEFFANATARLLAVKDAWRNPNAHEVGQKYTNQEAAEIYESVRAFMEQISTKLGE